MTHNGCDIKFNGPRLTSCQVYRQCYCNHNCKTVLLGKENKLLSLSATYQSSHMHINIIDHGLLKWVPSPAICTPLVPCSIFNIFFSIIISVWSVRQSHFVTGPLSIIKTLCYGYKDSHYKPKLVLPRSRFYHGHPYTNKTVSSSWIEALVLIGISAKEPWNVVLGGFGGTYIK